MSETLTNGTASVRFEDVCASSEMYPKLLRFLAPYFYPAGEDMPPDLTIRFRDGSEFASAAGVTPATPVCIRESTASAFNLVVVVGHAADGDLVAWDPERETGYRIDTEQRRAEFFSSADSFIHLIEFVRYYSLLVEERAGTLVLQAAALRDRHTDRVTVICGPKGAGKTTTVLRGIHDQGKMFLSGDRVLLRRDQTGGVVVRGWPDYPHVGLGSLREAPEFAARVGVDLKHTSFSDRADDEKILIDPECYYSALEVPASPSGALESLMFPDVRASRTRRRELARDERSPERLAASIEAPSTFQTATWHGIQPRMRGSRDEAQEVLARLSALPWIEEHTRARKRSPAAAGS